jgi:hypothetical protein
VWHISALNEQHRGESEEMASAIQDTTYSGGKIKLDRRTYAAGHTLVRTKRVALWREVGGLEIEPKVAVSPRATSTEI